MQDWTRRSPTFPNNNNTLSKMVALITFLSTLFGISPVTGSSQFLYKDDTTNPDAKAVIEVTDTTGFFQSAISAHRVVKFYSPYCGHCISFKKKYMKVAAQARIDYDNLEFYAVSCAALPDLCEQYAIQVYPSVLAYPAGTPANNSSQIDVGSVLFFSVSKVAKALKLQTSSTAMSRQLQDDAEENAEGAAGDDGMRKAEVEDVTEDEDDGDDEEERGTAKQRVVKLISMTTTTPPILHNQAVDDDNVVDEEGIADEIRLITNEATPMRKKAGADNAMNKPRNMDEWKEEQRELLLRKRHNKFLQRHQVPSNATHNFNDPTPIMLANRRGTSAFEERQRAMALTLERMRRFRRKKKTAITTTANIPTNQTQFRKKVTAPRLVESVPIVQRVVTMTKEEELILDASLSFLEGLRVGVYRSQGPLEPQLKRALRDWLELMRISLPPEWALQETLGVLLDNFDRVASNKATLNAILVKHSIPRSQWSKSCQRSGNEFACGFWKLLHVATVGIAEHRGGQDLIDSGILKSTARIFSPLEAADTIRAYIVHFFICTDCAQHFAGMYDQCEMHRRCDRLTDDALSATDADWKELAKWLWEVHNSVSVRVLNKHSDEQRKKKQRSLLFRAPAGPGVANRKDQAKALWPTVNECVSCFREDGSYNEEAVFLYLETIYWPGHDLKDTPRRLIWLEDDGEGSLGLNSILLVMVLIIIVTLRSRIGKASMAQTMLLRAKAMKTRVTDGKLRTI